MFFLLYLELNNYISIKYKADGNPNYSTEQDLKWKMGHGAAVQFGSPRREGTVSYGERRGESNQAG